MLKYMLIMCMHVFMHAGVCVVCVSYGVCVCIRACILICICMYKCMLGICENIYWCMSVLIAASEFARAI